MTPPNGSPAILQPAAFQSRGLGGRLRIPERPFRLRLRWAWSFETLIILSLFGGVRGGSTLGLPVDPTWLFVGISFLVGCVVLLGGARFSRRSVSLVAFAGAFCLLVILSLGYTVSEVYARDKAILDGTLTLWMLVAGSLIISQSPHRTVRLACILFWFSTAVGVLTLAVHLRGGGDLVPVFGAAYLSLSRILGFGVTLGIGYLVFAGPGGRARLLTFFSLGLILTAMLFAGGRGPLVGCILAVSPLAVAKRPRSEFKTVRRHPLSRFVVVAALSALVIAPFLAIGPTRTVERIAVLFDTPDFGASGYARLEFYREAVDQWRAKLWLGNGVGSWPVLAGFGDSRGYPHNIVLEVGAEQGIVGVTALALLLLLALRALGPWSRLRSSPTLLTILMLLIYAMTSAFVSGDVPDNRVLFLLAGMCAVREALPDAWLGARRL